MDNSYASYMVMCCITGINQSKLLFYFTKFSITVRRKRIRLVESSDYALGSSSVFKCMREGIRIEFCLSNLNLNLSLLSLLKGRTLHTLYMGYVSRKLRSVTIYVWCLILQNVNEEPFLSHVRLLNRNIMRTKH